MPIIYELVDNVAAQISSGSIGDVWFTNFDIQNPYS